MTSTAPKPTFEREHTLYVEVLGKGGLWGAGYDVSLFRWLGVGATVSFSSTDGERVYSLSPYLTAYPLMGEHHRWFVHAGPQLFRVSTPSPVPEWSGTVSSGIGGEVSSGYEYRGRVVVRAYAMGAVGRNGATPWLGASLGWAL